MKRIPEEELQAIEEVVQQHPEGMTARQIAEALDPAPPRRTLQYRLKFLVDDKRLIVEGAGRRTRYRIPKIASLSAHAAFGPLRSIARLWVGPRLSESGAEIRDRARKPAQAREPVGYDRTLLDSYLPNRSFYLSAEERSQLRETGEAGIAEQPAGTYARQILNRLLIDLSWNSSRLEGNTYSLLDTQRLIEAGEEAEGKDALETQMILNHKEAIGFLVDGAADIGFDRYTVRNLHAALADNLLPDPEAPGRLRHRSVAIGGSVFHPLDAPQLVEECFDLILARGSAIEDPFEQAFFAMVHLPYLQPFDDMNKRVSRLAANIPLIRANLSPLSFEEVPRDLYTEAILGVYELQRTELLRDVFLWAYRRSAARYAAVRQSLGEPDPFRMRHRTALREVVAEIVRGKMDKRQAAAHVAEAASGRIDEPERERFREIAERELVSLHEGNFARYRIAPAEFEAWQAIWRQ